MRYHKIRKMDISNGPGVRVSIFMQGCTFNCKNCFNPETHDFNGGREFLDETIEKVLDLCSLDHIVGLSILGGEPMHPKNIDGNTKLAKMYQDKPFKVLSKDEYIDITCDQLEILNDCIVVHRLTGDPLKEELIEPRWILNKIDILNGIDKELKRRNTYQGIYNKTSQIN